MFFSDPTPVLDELGDGRRLPALRGQRLGQRIDQRDARHLGRILHREEEAGVGPLPRRERQEVDAVEGDRAGAHVVARAAGDDVRQRGLPRPVRTHHRVHLAALHREVDPAQDLAPADRDPKTFDAQLTHRTVTTTSPSTTFTS